MKNAVIVFFLMMSQAWVIFMLSPMTINTGQCAAFWFVAFIVSDFAAACASFTRSDRE